MTSLSSSFSVFPWVKGTVPTGQLNLAEMMARIRSEEFHPAVEAIRAAKVAGNDDLSSALKQQLPAVTISGTFRERNGEGLLAHSGLMVVDFDRLPLDSLQDLKARLIADPHVQAVFVSPSGAGLKVVVPIPADPATHGASFAAVVPYFKENLGLVADASGKDVCRLCFLSYDPDAFLRDGDAVAFIPVAEAPKTPRPIALTPPNAQEIRSALGALNPDIDYGQWIRIGMAIHAAMPGDEGLEIWENWSTGGAKYKPGECAKHWSGFRSGEITIATLFGLARDVGWRRTLTMGPRAAAPSAIPTAPVVAAPSANADIRAKLWAIAQTPKISAAELHQQIPAAVLEWLHGRGRFYYDQDVQAFGSVMYFDAERKLLLPVQGDAFLAWLSDSLAVNRADRTFAFVQAAVETEGLSVRSKPFSPSSFWASKPGLVYLSSGPGSMVRISAQGVEVVDNGTDGILFPYGATLSPWNLVKPVDPFETCSLFRDMSTMAPHGRDLFRLWVMCLPTDQRTKPPLVVCGTVGSGKTRLVRGVFELFGLPERISAVLKNGEEDFWVAVNAGGLACFDNADTRVEWLPDALAAAATAGVHEKRKLYTDNENVILRSRSGICITSANPAFASDPGLADRLLVVRLDRRRGNTAETTLSDEIIRNRDAGLSFIAHVLCRILADQEVVPSGLNSRHPDFAQMAVRIGRALGLENQSIHALKAAECDKSRFNIENDDLGAMLLTIGKFDGSAPDLKLALTKLDHSFAWSPQKLARRISNLWPHLQSTVGATRETGHGGGQIYHFAPPAGDIGDIERAFSENHPCERNIRRNPKTGFECHQCHQTPPVENAAPPVVVVPSVSNAVIGNGLQWDAEKVA